MILNPEIYVVRVLKPYTAIPCYRIPYFCAKTTLLTYLHYFHNPPFFVRPSFFPSFRARRGIQEPRTTANENHNSQTHTTQLQDTAFLRYDYSAYISSLLSLPPIFYHALSFTRHSALGAESRSTGQQRRKNAIHKRI